MALFGLKQVLSNFYAIIFLWRRCNFREKERWRQVQSRKCRARYRDVAKTTSSIRQSNYLPLLLYRIPLTVRLWEWRLRILDTVSAVCWGHRKFHFEWNWRGANLLFAILCTLEFLVALAFVARNSWITYNIKIQTFHVYSCKRTQNLSSKRPCSLFRKIDK